MSLKKLNITAAIMMFLGFLPGLSFAEPGILEDTIILGQSCALTGPAAELGTGMREGLNAYFHKINSKGGVNGRKIRLVSLDDGYEPDKAILNTRQLIAKENIFLAIGYVGTPTSKAAFPLLDRKDIPFLAPFTGAEFLRHPVKKNIINLRASYCQEMEKTAAYLVETLGIKKIACFYQNDEYGLAGLNCIKKALEKRSLSLCAVGKYERNSTAVKSGFLDIRRAEPRAVVMVGAYQPCAQFIKIAKKYGLQDAVFCNISFVGTRALINELGKEGNGTIITQVVQYPWNYQIPIVKEYMEDMIQFNPGAAISFITFEGYLAAKLFCDAAERTGRDLTRKNLIHTIEKAGTIDIGGIILTFGKDDHQGLDTTFLTIIKNGKAEPI